MVKRKSLEAIIERVRIKGKNHRNSIWWNSNGILNILIYSPKNSIVVGTYCREYDAENNRSRIIPENLLVVVSKRYLDPSKPNYIQVFGLPKNNYFVGISNPETRKIEKIIDYVRAVPEKVKL